MKLRQQIQERSGDAFKNCDFSSAKPLPGRRRDFSVQSHVSRYLEEFEQQQQQKQQKQQKQVLQLHKHAEQQGQVFELQMPTIHPHLLQEQTPSHIVPRIESQLQDVAQPHLHITDQQQQAPDASALRSIIRKSIISKQESSPASTASLVEAVKSGLDARARFRNNLKIFSGSTCTSNDQIKMS